MTTEALEIPQNITRRWQEIVDLLAEIVRVPAALIMRVEPPEIIVFVCSASEKNPYVRSERARLATDLYCETVMTTRSPLLVPNALSDERWKSNPDVKLGMISYLGLPITWPSGQVFGTICALDDRENHYNQPYQRLLLQFRDAIETDLNSLSAREARGQEEARTKALLEAQVAERTAALTAANEALQRDIVERRHAEDALLTSQRLLQAIADNSTAIIYIKDLDGRHLFVNRRFEELLHLSREGVLGKSDHDLFGAEVADAFRAFDRQVLAGRKALEAEEKLLLDDGLHTYISVKCPLFDASGTLYALCGVSTDITERKRIEVERASLLVREQQARLVAEEANVLKDEFLAVLSHELRTPLTSILGWTSILQSREVDAPMLARGLQVIERNARMQTQIIEDLLDLSSILAHDLHLTLHPTALDPILASAVSAARPAAEAKGLQLTLTGPEQPLFIDGDSARLRQIVDNLLSNAIKFTTAPGRVDVSCERRGGEAVLRVRDTGKGISRDFLPHVFERFRQQNSTRTRAFGGLGIGLTIVHELVERHGGTSTAESAGEGQGSTFLVRFPLLDADRLSVVQGRPQPRLDRD
jgi:PAS domain S-box-containing protein